MDFFLDNNEMIALGKKHHEEFISGKPFPYIVIDNFLPEDVANAAVDCFPDLRGGGQGVGYDAAPEKRKFASRGEEGVPDFIRKVFYQFNSLAYINFLENLTGIKGLVPDPHLIGGGLHQTYSGGYLSVHADFNKHDILNLDRRVNVLLYLNRDWKPEYGGDLELWDREMTACAHKIEPLFNRMAIFRITDFSYHGHPDPLTCPDDRSRQSLAFYYYTNGRPEGETIGEDHTTLFQARPNEMQSVRDHLANPNRLSPKQVIKKFIPPIFIDMYRAVK